MFRDRQGFLYKLLDVAHVVTLLGHRERDRARQGRDRKSGEETGNAEFRRPRACSGGGAGKGAAGGLRGAGGKAQYAAIALELNLGIPRGFPFVIPAVVPFGHCEEAQPTWQSMRSIVMAGTRPGGRPSFLMHVRKEGKGACPAAPALRAEGLPEARPFARR